MNEGSPTSGSGEPGAAPAQPEVPAGWYPHPTAPGWEAYWTGSGWGTETRPAQPQPETPPAPAAEPQTATQPAEAAAQQQAAAQQPAAASEPATAQQPAQAAAMAAPAATATATPAAERGRSESALPVILCVLGAVVAIVGSFLPQAKLDFNGTEVDLADNTMVAAGYGIAVIAAAVIAAGIAIWAYAKTARTWVPILVGAIIVAIAVYAGTAGLDVTPDFAPPGLSLDDAGDPSTGVFAVGAGGLLIILGGIGIARNR
ncbi:MAG TPA: hypothetical protein VFS73_07430 [Solirubrobacterales bacterium]|jgi:hypothetical protein|nr:hypothetical protein [Solirubrobacterales bacterium]